jgi:HK97 family phage portal protein
MGLTKYLRPGWARQDALERVTIIDPPEPLEGTLMSIWNSILPNWYAEQDGSSLMGTADLAERVWTANVCQHKNSMQIGGMPLRWHGSTGVDEPRWVSNPSPSQFPNGISDAMYAITDQMYGYGYALLYVTSDYESTGYPRTWDVVSSAACIPYWDAQGQKVYKVGDTVLDPARVVQIDRDPTPGAAHGTSALAAYAQRAYSLLAAGNKSLAVSTDAQPSGYLATEQRLTSDQADDVRDQWMTKRAAANGAPAVLSQGLEFKATGINPQDLALLDTQEWDARVICTAYGVPSVLLNMAMQGGLTYQNPLALMQMWWLTELRPTAKRIVDAFTANLLPAGQWVSVDASDITQEPTDSSDEDDPQLSQVAKASPAQQPGGLTAIGGGRT